MRGVPLWGSLVAVIEDETRARRRDRTSRRSARSWWRRAATGCWWNGIRCAVSTVVGIAEGHRRHAPTSGSARNPARGRALGARSPAASALARTWGDCYGYVLVATGRAELMVDDRLSPWDVGGRCMPIIEEAGGVFTDWQGQRGMGLRRRRDERPPRWRVEGDPGRP